MAKVNSISPTLSEVQRVLGYFPNTVAGVCRYSGINKWAKYKPFRSSALEYPDQKALLAALKAAAFGLSWNGGPDLDDFTMLLPQGGQNTPCRLGDFRGYDHFTKNGFGVVAPTINITPSNITGSHDITILGGDDSDYIGYWDLCQTLFADYPYLWLDMVMPHSGKNVSDSIISVTSLNMKTYSSVPRFTISNRLLCKLGRTDDGPGTFRTFIATHDKSWHDDSFNPSGYAYADFSFQNTTPYRASFKVGSTDLDSWAWNRADAFDKVLIGTGNSGGYDLQPFAHYTDTLYGSPIYLDLTHAERLYINTNTVLGGDIPLNRDSVWLRITNWLTQQEFYLSYLGSGTSLGDWELNGATGLILGINATQLPDMGTNMFGFSLVYEVDAQQSQFIPLTKELFARVKFPSGGSAPSDIFNGFF